MKKILGFIASISPYVIVSVASMVYDLPVLAFVTCVVALVISGIYNFTDGLRRGYMTALKYDAERHEMFMQHVKEHYDITPKTHGPRG